MMRRILNRDCINWQVWWCIWGQGRPMVTISAISELEIDGLFSMMMRSPRQRTTISNLYGAIKDCPSAHICSSIHYDHQYSQYHLCNLHIFVKALTNSSQPCLLMSNSTFKERRIGIPIYLHSIREILSSAFSSGSKLRTVGCGFFIKELRHRGQDVRVVECHPF